MDEFDIPNAVGHLVAGSAVLTTIAGMLPPAVALVALVWYVIQIYESKTFQRWYRDRQVARRAKTLEKLRAREKAVLAKIAALEETRSTRGAADHRHPHV